VGALGPKIASLVTSSQRDRVMDGFAKLLRFGSKEFGAISVLLFRGCGKDIGDCSRSSGSRPST